MQTLVLLGHLKFFLKYQGLFICTKYSQPQKRKDF